MHGTDIQIIVPLVTKRSVLMRNLLCLVYILRTDAYHPHRQFNIHCLIFDPIYV